MQWPQQETASQPEGGSQYQQGTGRTYPLGTHPEGGKERHATQHRALEQGDVACRGLQEHVQPQCAPRKKKQQQQLHGCGY